MCLGKSRLIRSALVLVLIASFASISMSQQIASRQRITQSVDNSRLAKLPGNTHPLARAEFDRGRAPDSLAADRVLLLLSRSPEQEAALAQLLDEQQTSGSANYRRWLAPEEFGQKFGPADTDVQAITAWLQTQGFRVNRVSKSKGLIEFSGNAGQVRASLHTELHKYVVSGKEYWANATDPQIPAALAPAVKGIVSLNNFPHKPQYRKQGVFSRTVEGTIRPQVTLPGDNNTTYYGVGPADFATIYKTSSLLSAGTNGTGQTIALIGESNINLQDVTDFRSFFGLSTGSTSVILDGSDPGLVDGEETESLLDVEWAGAVAPSAAVKLVSAASTITTSGIFLAANYVIEQNLAGVLSLSYSGCEPELGTTGNQFMQALWQQAAAQGITVVVSTGDEGSASCDYHLTSDIAVNGLAVNGFASTPYNVAVGGTDFVDASLTSTYWNTTENPTTLGSALSYIPERTWNETCAATATAGNLAVCPQTNPTDPQPQGISVVAASGGASNCSTSVISNNQVVCQSGTPKPAWQSGTGVPADGVRDLPDVSLFASGGGTSSNTFYIMCEADVLPAGYSSCQKNQNTTFLTVGGTSASAPAFAGIVALLNQKAGTRLGNINYLLYSIAAKAGSSCTSGGSPAATCVFNDVVSGNSSVPCAAGSPNCSQTSGTATGVLVDSKGNPAFTTTAGYDLATGLGSVNAANLATAIVSAETKFTATTTALTLNAGTSTVTAKHGDAINVAVSVSPTTATGAVALEGGGGSSIDNATLVAGASAWTSKLFPGGNYTVNAHYPGDGTRAASDSNGVRVSISPEDSQTFLEIMSWDDTGHFLGYNSPSVPYGSSYILRMDVGDTAATLSPTSGVNSKCWNGTASCPTGTITVTANGAALDGGTYKLNSAGFAEDQIINLNTGTYTLAANYSGDASYNANTSQSTLTVTTAPVDITFTPDPSVALVYGTPFWFTVNIASLGYGVAPSGTITLLDNGVAMSGPSVSYLSYSPYPRNGSTPAHLAVQGRVQFNTVGDHIITVQYSGDSRYSATTSTPSTLTIKKATPTVYSTTMSPNPTTPDLPVKLQFQFCGTSTVPTGTLTLSDNGTPLNVSLNITNGPWNFYIVNASLTLTSTGSHVIAANYPGDDNYAPVTLTLGTVTVYTQVPTTSTQPYADMNPALVNNPNQLSARVLSALQGPTPQGTVTFYDNGVALPPPVVTPLTSEVIVQLSYTFTTTGTHNITTSYSGDAETAASTSPALALNVVDKLPTSTTLNFAGSPIQNQSTTLSATVYSAVYSSLAPNLTGSVKFYDNGVEIPGTVTGQNNYFLQAQATYTFTTTGSHSVTANYSGDASFAPSESAARTLSVEGPLDLMLTGGGSDYTIAGGGGTLNIGMQLTNNTSTTDTVTISCTVDSTAATCTPSASSMTLSPGSISQISFGSKVPALSASARPLQGPWRGNRGLWAAALLACCVFAVRRRKKLLVIAGLLVLALSLFSCGGGGGGGSSTGGGGGNPPPTSKTYHFSVKVTDGTNTVTQSYTVTVGS